METMTEVPAEAAYEGDSTSPARDFDAEAKALGWRPVEEFAGDKARFVGAKEFIERGETMLPLVKAELAKSKQEIAELKKQMRKSAEHFSKAEERAYQRAVSELQARHDQAVEDGDKVAANRVVAEMRTLEKDFAAPTDPAKDDAEEARAEAGQQLAAWIQSSDWYMVDEAKTKYADVQADLMGLPHAYPGGAKEFLAELEKRVSDKFAARKPAVTNGNGQPAPAGKGGKSYADLPPEAKRLCDKWVKSGIIKTREDYVKSYDWS